MIATLSASGLSPTPIGVGTTPIPSSTT